MSCVLLLWTFEHAGKKTGTPSKSSSVFFAVSSALCWFIGLTLNVYMKSFTHFHLQLMNGNVAQRASLPFEKQRKTSTLNVSRKYFIHTAGYRFRWDHSSQIYLSFMRHQKSLYPRWPQHSAQAASPRSPRSHLPIMTVQHLIKTTQNASANFKSLWLSQVSLLLISIPIMNFIQHLMGQALSAGVWMSSK